MNKKEITKLLHGDMKNEGLKGWKKDYLDGIITRKGFIGKRNYASENAHNVYQHYNYSGSGPHSFGGSNKWPVVETHVGFPEGNEDLARELAVRQAKLIDEFLKEKGL